MEKEKEVIDFEGAKKRIGNLLRENTDSDKLDKDRISKISGDNATLI